nr:PREDICTED: uncharacterized protein LOC105663995 [Megachile rotundata]
MEASTTNYIQSAICVKDRRIAFSYKFSQDVGRLCGSCVRNAHPDAKKEWWSAGNHHFIKRESATQKARCMRCKIRFSVMLPAMACTTCRNRISQMDSDEEEAFNAGVLLNSDGNYPIIELENVRFYQAQI